MHEMGLAKIYLYTKFDISSHTHSNIYGKGLKLKIRPWTLTTPFLEYFVKNKMGLVKIHPYTQFKVSSFTRSKDMAHVPLNR